MTHLKLYFALIFLNTHWTFSQSESTNLIIQQKMKIEIWSDVACPFCYIGKRNFEKAINSSEFKNDIEVIWKSFELTPGLKTDTSISIEKFLSERKGYPLQHVQQMNKNVVSMGKNVGIDFNLDKIVVANTYLAHNFIHFANAYNLQNQAKEALLNAYFTRGLNVDDTTVLLKIGGELGLDKQKLHQAFVQKSFATQVNLDVQEARDLGVSGVPFFVFNRKYAVNGAQETEVFKETIDKAFKEWRAQNPINTLEITDGKSCTVDEICE